jgi:glutaredoxin
VIDISEKRKVEVFTADCPLCDETVQLVKKLSCPSDDVTIYNLREKEGIDAAKEYGINSVPTVVINGKVLDCCKRSKLTEADFKAAV